MLLVICSFFFQVMIANCILLNFLDLLEIPVLINFNWLSNLAFSCVAALSTNFIKIGLPHTLSNALSVGELNRLGFNDRSGGVRFVYYFFSLQLI